jgi:hypothetical protein
MHTSSICHLPTDAQLGCCLLRFFPFQNYIFVENSYVQHASTEDSRSNTALDAASARCQASVQHHWRQQHHLRRPCAKPHLHECESTFLPQHFPFLPLKLHPACGSFASFTAAPVSLIACAWYVQPMARALARNRSNKVALE